MDNTQVIFSNLLTRREVAERLRCSLTTLDRLGIPFIKIRRRKYFRQETVNNWLAENEQLKEAQS